MFPEFVMVKQKYQADKILNIEETVNQTLRELAYDYKDLAGKTVGIAVGSRGIANLPLIVKTVVSFIKAQKGNPVIFPAMGSHGATTPSGQREILESLGITEAAVGAPIKTSTECVFYGRTEDGMKVYGTKVALTFERIVLINRIKPHTDFEDITESGLYKLMAIGIGSHEGAKNVHNAALRMGYGPAIRAAGTLMLQKLPVVFGIAVTENWQHETDCIKGVLPADILETEKRLLKKVKDNAIQLPVKDFDNLIIQEAGKDISGTCVDTKVIGRIMIPGQREPESPKIKTIAVLDVTEASHGNAIGLGLVDLITKKAFDKIDIEATSLNGRTSVCLSQAKVPCVAPNDYECIEDAFKASGIETVENIKSIWIKNTNSLEILAVSKKIYEEIKDNSHIEQISGFFQLEFDKEGRLITDLSVYH